MVRARGVQVSSAAAPTVLGTAVVRAALLGLLHQSHPGLQKAQSVWQLTIRPMSFPKYASKPQLRPKIEKPCITCGQIDKEERAACVLLDSI